MTNPKDMPRRSNPNQRPSLRLSPYAWAKLLYLRDLGETEVGGFGISTAEDLLTIQDIRLVQQVCTAVTVKFSDQSVADYFDQCVDEGLRPEQFARIWMHTHPGNSATPSSTDEDTFARCFGNSDWSVMLIVAAGGQTYARLHFRAGPGGDLELPVKVDFDLPFPASDHNSWRDEHAAGVRAVCPFQYQNGDFAELYGPFGPALFPDEVGPFDPFLENPYDCDRSFSAASRIIAATCH